MTEANHSEDSPVQRYSGDSLQKLTFLASDLSADGKCPFPSSHDKLSEAHYFIHQMLDNYHYPMEFRFSLNAFLQATRSTTLLLQKELPKDEKFQRWYKTQQEIISQDEDLKLLN